MSKKYLSGELAAERLYLKPEKFYEEQNINIFLDSYVEEIDRKNSQLVFLKDKNHINFDYDNLVIATGTEPRLMPTDNSDMEDMTLKIKY